MEQPNRRKFLIIAGAGAGAAAVGVAAAKTGLTGPDAPSASTPAAVPAGAGPLVAYVEDAGSGRVAVMVGDGETVVHDPDLVARLSRAASGRTA
jgi:hypothetical protein